MSELNFTLRGLLAHAWYTVQNPREGLSALMALGLDRGTLWLALALVATLSAILSLLGSLLLGVPGVIAGPVVLPPLSAAMLEASTLVITVFAVFWIGRAAGGTGTFEDSILAVAWLWFIILCVQAVQTVLLVTGPLLPGLLSLFGVALMFYLLTQFVALIHGFISHLKVFLMIIVSLVGLTVGFTIILAIIGVNISGQV